MEAARAQAKVLRSDKKVSAEIDRDAGGWIARNQNPNREAADFDEVKHENRMRTARERHREKTAVTFEEVRNDIITGTVTTPEEIDGRTARLNAAVGVQLKELLGLRLNHAEAARLRSPEVQKELAGRISSGLLRYTIDAEDYDKGFTAIAGDIGNLVDGPVKEQFQKELASAREGKQREIRTHADHYLKAIDDEWANHGFGRRRDAASEVGPPDPAAAARIADGNQEAERRYGDAKSKFIQWLALNPTVKEDAIRKKAFDLMKAHVREQASGNLIGPAPALDG